MKTLAAAILIVGSGLFNGVEASGSFNMNEKLDEVLRFESNSLSIEKNQTAFVKVSFKINASGKLEILEANYSDESIKEQLMQKLNNISIDAATDTDKVYYYHFTFKKM
ncbi:MAG: hypothetical protein KDD41_02460 [Flavobacteriales bacterium]|nr:hypothetical protein [Flavobacteriales bacterium]